jgi:hypothetical protein
VTFCDASYSSSWQQPVLLLRCFRLVVVVHFRWQHTSKKKNAMMMMMMMKWAIDVGVAVDADTDAAALGLATDQPLDGGVVDHVVVVVVVLVLLVVTCAAVLAKTPIQL